MQKLIMLRGLPASGKSQFAKDYCKTMKKSVRINNDDLRASLYGREFSKVDEDNITDVRNWLIAHYVGEGYDIVVDNTNLNPIHERGLRSFATTEGLHFEVRDFLTDVETCIERDKLRGENAVGEKVIRDMATKYNYPTKPQEFPKVIQEKEGKLNAYIFDIDGTLAFMNGRSPYDFTRVGEDGVHEDVKEVMDELRFSGADILLCSGRGEEAREATEKWLRQKGIYFDSLFMRKLGDKRKDSIVKYEILTNEILHRWYVKGVWDDRNSVCKMWREAGVRCYQVAEGDF